MISGAEFELARAAREGLDQARTLLIAPTLAAMARVTPALEASAESLACLETRLRATADNELGATQQLRRELRSLKNSLSGVERLMAGAAAFYSGWGGLIGTTPPGYSRTGQIQRAVEAASMDVRG